MHVSTSSQIQLQCSDGIVLAAQSWRADSNNNNAIENNNDNIQRQRVLCLHGWMDNCRSFHYLAPAIVSNRPHVDLVALDFVGHGLSSHKSADGPSLLLSEAVFYVAEALRLLGWDKNSIKDDDNDDDKDDDKDVQNQSPNVTLVGHSMGAGVSCVYAAAFPEQISKLVLLEGAGPLDRNPRDVAKHVRSHVTRRMDGNRNTRPPRLYPTLERAIQMRCKTAENFPGNQWLSTEASTELVLRGTEWVEAESANDNDNNNGKLQSGFRFRHDPRLQWPSCHYLSFEQVSALYKDIRCPTGLFLARSGWPFDEGRLQESLGLLQPTVFEKDLPGSHHFHSDPETAETVSRKVIQFLEL